DVTNDGLEHVNVSIGQPIANTVCRVLDGTGDVAPIGVRGELFIGGAGVARGYFNRDELTRERFVPDPFDTDGRLYRTGDLARWLPDGSLEFLGRRDFQVKVRGHRVELGEIEAALRAHDGIADAVVVADGAGASARLVAYLIPVDSQSEPTVGELRAWLQTRPPDYMIPARFGALEQFPTTPSRKIDRNALPRPDATVETAAAYVAPRGPVEHVVAGTFEEVLGLERVGADDNFFELGGHSLHATSILSKLAAIFGVE